MKANIHLFLIIVIFFKLVIYYLPGIQLIPKQKLFGFPLSTTRGFLFQFSTLRDSELRTATGVRLHSYHVHWEHFLVLPSKELTDARIVPQVSYTMYLATRRLSIAKHTKSKNRMQITEFPARLGQNKRLLRKIEEM